MRRIGLAVVLTLGLILASLAADAQRPDKVSRIGYLVLSPHAVRRQGMARDLLHDRNGALADERDRHRMGAHAVARGAAGGVGDLAKALT